MLPVSVNLATIRPMLCKHEILPPFSQRWAIGQNEVGPITDSNWFGQRRINISSKASQRWDTGQNDFAPNYGPPNVFYLAYVYLYPLHG